MTSVLLSVLAVLFLIFFGIYKKDMLIRMFSLNVAGPANELREQLEVVANSAVKRMEDQMTQLELLMEEAETKTLALDKYIQVAEKMLLQQQNEYQQLVAFRQQLTSFQEEMIASLRQQRETIKPLFSEPAEVVAVEVVTVPEQGEPLTVNEMKVEAALDTGTDLLSEEMAGDKKGLVIAMSEQGYDVTEIAKSTGVGQGEIQLLLQLHKK
ncbi:MAG TPA: hypothetical protein VN611_07040 [Patescibacteria group bacterium]|nr:hypothetical protein [Patescibacteria group bacterium]